MNVDTQAVAAAFAACWLKLQEQAPNVAPTHIDPGEAGAAVIKALRQQQPEPKFQPLDRITSEFVSTEVCAYHANREQQTLRWWHHRGISPIRVVRKNGRLAWNTDSLREFVRKGSGK